MGERGIIPVRPFRQLAEQEGAAPTVAVRYAAALIGIRKCGKLPRPRRMRRLAYRIDIMGVPEPTFPWVYVVDDDRGIRTSLVTLLNASDIAARPFAEPHHLLEELDNLSAGLFLIDVRMPGISGIQLLTEIRARDCYWPAAIMTAHGEIPLAVSAMKLGAIEFLEKPFSDVSLKEFIAAGMEQLPDAAATSSQCKVARQLLSGLSPRQKQVFDGVVNGLTSKEIAKRHGLSHRTVESYRQDMMNKLGVTQLVDLFELKPFANGGDNAGR
jgi:two-component system response regulator FixJ